MDEQQEQLVYLLKEQEKLQDAKANAQGELAELQSELESTQNSSQHLYAQIGEANQKLEETIRKSEQDFAVFSVGYSETKQQNESLTKLNREMARQLAEQAVFQTRLDVIAAERDVAKVQVAKLTRQLAELEALNAPTTLGDEVLKRILEATPQAVTGMRNSLQYFLRHSTDVQVLQDLGQNVSVLLKQIAAIQYHPIYKITHSIDVLIAKLIQIPQPMGRNTQRTLGQGFDSLASLVHPKTLHETNHLPQPSVLVIDDELEIANYLADALKKSNLKATTCLSPKSALDLLTYEKYDLILLDIKMPEMSGLELCPMIRRISHHQKTPIVFITGVATPEVRANSSLAGGNDLLTKPFEEAEIALKSLVWIYKGQLEGAQKMRQAA